MSAGVQELSHEQLDSRVGYALGLLSDDARRAWRWLRRGYPATSIFLPSFIRRGLLRLSGMQIGAAVYGLEHCWFQSPHIEIGDGAAIGRDCWFEGNGHIHVGANTLVASRSLILTSTHPLDAHGAISRQPEACDTWIGDRCWLGAGVTVMPGVRVGDGVTIAAGAVVTRDCEPGGVYGGVPARRIR